jgi:hypothetical protein
MIGARHAGEAMKGLIRNVDVLNGSRAEQYPGPNDNREKEDGYSGQSDEG